VPHFVVEYTANLADETDIRSLLKKANAILIDQDGLFPIGGIRSRAIELTDYVMSDDEEDYAFVHASLTVGAGRDKADLKKACDALFEMMKAHFSEIYNRRYLALSMEFSEFSEAGTYKQNNVHARFKK
jgi:5-carboxymethyl-2-hydroxymuconate isomerase